jgi:hypothetical protein
MTLGCVWLSYIAWRHHDEQQIVAGIKARDPKARILWAGPAWLSWLDADSVPEIFRRVHVVTLEVTADVALISQLRLERLTSLRELDLADSGGSFMGHRFRDDDDRQEVASVQRLLPGVKVAHRGDVTAVWDQLISDYLQNPTAEAANEVRKVLGPPWRFAYPPFSNSPDEIPIPLQPCSAGPYNLPMWGSTVYGLKEENLAKLLACGDRDLGIMAAKHLWEGHSRRHAGKVIAFATALTPDSDLARDLKSTIESDLAPESILAGLRRPRDVDIVWWAWLAAMRPDPLLMPALAQLADEREPLAEATYALRLAKESLPLSDWLAVLARCEHKRGRCIAADVIRQSGDSTTEPQLVEALRREDSLTRSAVCDALAKVGTRRSLPALRRLLNDPGDRDGFNVKGAALKAIEAIEWRSR